MTTPAGPFSTAHPAPPRRRRSWLIGGLVAWALVLLAAVALSVERDPPTVREQRSIAQAAPVVDRAAGELVRAAGEDAVAVISPSALVEGCRITPARPGAVLRREITVHTTPEGGPVVLERLAERLPAAYRVRVRVTDETTGALRGDAGDFVGIRGTIASPGVVRLTVDTGCRPRSPSSAVDAEPAAVTVPCPDGGVVRTTLAQTSAASGRPGAAVPAPGGATVLVDEPDRYVYRTGEAGVVVVRQGEGVRAYTTGGCQ